MLLRHGRLAVVLATAALLVGCSGTTAPDTTSDDVVDAADTKEVDAGTEASDAAASDEGGVDEYVLRLATTPPGLDEMTPEERRETEAYVEAVRTGGPCNAAIINGVLSPIIAFGLVAQEQAPVDAATWAWVLGMAAATAPDLDGAPPEIAAEVRRVSAAFLDFADTFTDADWSAAAKGDAAMLDRISAHAAMIGPAEDGATRAMEDWLRSTCADELVALGFDWMLDMTTASTTEVEGPAGPAADTSTPEDTVLALLAALRAGDDDAVAALSTPQGLEFVAGLAGDDDLDIYGPFACSTTADAALCLIEIGQGISMTATPDGWRVDNLATMSGPPPAEYCVEDVTPLNVRPAPGTDNEPIGTYAVDACDVYDLTEPATVSGDWRRVSRRGLVGWVYDPHLRRASGEATTAAPQDLQEFLVWVARSWVAGDYGALATAADDAAIDDLDDWVPDDAFVRFDSDCLPGSSGNGGCSVGFVEDGAGWAGTFWFTEDPPGWRLVSLGDVESTS